MKIADVQRPGNIPTHQHIHNITKTQFLHQHLYFFPLQQHYGKAHPYQWPKGSNLFQRVSYTAKKMGFNEYTGFLTNLAIVHFLLFLFHLSLCLTNFYFFREFKSQVAHHFAYRCYSMYFPEATLVCQYNYTVIILSNQNNK